MDRGSGAAQQMVHKVEPGRLMRGLPILKARPICPRVRVLDFMFGHGFSQAKLKFRVAENGEKAGRLAAAPAGGPATVP